MEALSGIPTVSLGASIPSVVAVTPVAALVDSRDPEPPLLISDVMKKIETGDLILQPNAGGSDVWGRFLLVVDRERGKSQGYVQCTGCKTLLRYVGRKTGTSHLRRHTCSLGSPRERKPRGARGLSLAMSAILPNKLAAAVALKVPVKVKTLVTEKCVAFCCRDLRPFDATAGDGFLELAQCLINVGASCGKLDARQVLPHPTSVSRRSVEIAAALKNKIRPELYGVFSKYGGGIATDIWTDIMGRITYVSLTAHYVSNDWKLQDRVLCAVEFDHDVVRTADDIRNTLFQNLNDLGFDATTIPNAIFVTDRDSIVAASLFDNEKVDCVAHILNTVLKYTFDAASLEQEAPQVVALLTACKALVIHLRRAGLEKQILRLPNAEQEAWWIAKFDTLKSLRDQYDDIVQLLTECDELHLLTGLQRDLLDLLLAFLQPFKQVTNDLEASQKPTLHLVMLWYVKLQQHCQPCTEDPHILALLKTRTLQFLQQEFQLHSLHKLATFLWPRFKQLKMLDALGRDTVVGEVRSRVASIRVPSELPPDSTAPSPDTAAADGRLSSLEMDGSVAGSFTEWEDSPEVDEIQDEVGRYLSAKVAPNEGQDVLQWWAKEESHYPRLAVLARSVLAVPATSVPRDRDHSLIGVVEERRRALKTGTVNDILFLHSNMPRSFP